MAAPSSSVDDFDFSSLYDEDQQLISILDETYAEQLQLQEALLSSSAMFSSTLQNGSSSSEQRENFFPNSELKSLGERQVDQSFCTICLDPKPTNKIFQNHDTCSHLFCSDCMSKYIAAKVQANAAMVKCPDLKCTKVIGPELCRSIVPQEVLERWENALCESLILGSQKFYCPFKDCSAMLVDDGAEVVTVSECPNCRRLFCAQCKVSWHAGMECGEFRGLKKSEKARDDEKLMELAQKQKWRRCSKCKFFVEKVDGCLHISCRCGHQFCYQCGSQYTAMHSCQ